jgi:MFS transporter, FHS family, glucose/mannose:H+ symporter
VNVEGPNHNANDGRFDIAPITFGALVLVYILIGLAVSAYGPLFSALTAKFHVPLSTAGLVVSIHFAGAFVGLLTSMQVSSRARSFRLITVALAIFGAGCLGVALAHVWGVLLVSVFFVGIGWGGLAMEVNQVLVRSNEKNRAARLNIVNGGFGLGAILGPLSVAILKNSALPWDFALAGAIALVLAPFVSGVKTVPHRDWDEVIQEAPTSNEGKLRQARNVRRIFILFIVAIFVYTGVETGIGSWAPTYLMSVGYSQRTAAIALTLFWAGLTVGRFLAVPIVARVSSRAIVLTALTLAVALLLASNLSSFSYAAIILTGLIVAPIFPMGMAWMVNAVPNNPKVSSWYLIAATVGEITVPAIVRYGVSVSTEKVIPVILGGACIVAWLSFICVALVEHRGAKRAR